MKARASGSRVPPAADRATSARLGQVRQRDTAPELKVRRILKLAGVRSGRSRRRLPGSPDVLNLAQKWCIFVHGCFWHRHTGCARATTPRNNAAFWREKFRANKARDRRVQRTLRAKGFQVLVIWECTVVSDEACVLRRLKKLKPLTF